MVNNKNNNNEKLIAVLSYLLIGLIWYALDENARKSSFTKFHVKQAINLMIISVVVQIAFSIIGGLLAITIILIPFVFLISMALSFAFLVLWIIGLINAINGEKRDVPVIGIYANKYLNF